MQQVVACRDLTGFGEIVPGSTMLATKTEDMAAALGDDREKWMRYINTLVGVIVTTAIFDITVLLIVQPCALMSALGQAA